MKATQFQLRKTLQKHERKKKYPKTKAANSIAIVLLYSSNIWMNTFINDLGINVVHLCGTLEIGNVMWRRVES